MTSRFAALSMAALACACQLVAGIGDRSEGDAGEGGESDGTGGTKGGRGGSSGGTPSSGGSGENTSSGGTGNDATGGGNMTSAGRGGSEQGGESATGGDVAGRGGAAGSGGKGAGGSSGGVGGSNGGKAGTGGSFGGSGGTFGGSSFGGSGVAGSPVALCNQVPACGGDIAGDWEWLESCSDVAAMTENEVEASGCSGVEVIAATEMVSGTMTFTEDLRYSDRGTRSGGEVIFFPFACYDLTCEQMTDTFAGSDPALADSFCLDETWKGLDGCLCSLIVSPRMSLASGTYSTVGDELTISITGLPLESYRYCRLADTLHVLQLDPDGDVVTDSVAVRK